MKLNDPAFLLGVHHGAPRSEVLLWRLLPLWRRRGSHSRREPGAGVVELHHVLVVWVRVHLRHLEHNSKKLQLVFEAQYYI